MKIAETVKLDKKEPNVETQILIAKKSQQTVQWLGILKMLATNNLNSMVSRFPEQTMIVTTQGEKKKKEKVPRLTNQHASMMWRSYAMKC